MRDTARAARFQFEIESFSLKRRRKQCACRPAAEASAATRPGNQFRRDPRGTNSGPAVAVVSRGSVGTKAQRPKRWKLTVQKKGVPLRFASTLHEWDVARRQASMPDEARQLDHSARRVRGLTGAHSRLLQERQWDPRDLGRRRVAADCFGRGGVAQDSNVSCSALRRTYG
jgi:hypothetical protein